MTKEYLEGIQFFAGGNLDSRRYNKQTEGSMIIHVDNLADEVSPKDLRRRFGKYGNIESVRIVMDLVSGKSKGYAYVDMLEREQAEEAIAELNGRRLRKKMMKVGVYKPAKNRRGGRAMGNQGGGGIRRW